MITSALLSSCCSSTGCAPRQRKKHGDFSPIPGLPLSPAPAGMSAGTGLPHPPCSCRASGRTCKRLRRIHLCISRFPSPPKPHLHSPCSLFTLYTPPVPHRFIFLHFYFCIRKPETAHSPMPVSGVSLSVSALSPKLNLLFSCLPCQCAQIPCHSRRFRSSGNGSHG